MAGAVVDRDGGVRGARAGWMVCVPSARTRRATRGGVQSASDSCIRANRDIGDASDDIIRTSVRHGAGR
jgi:hypothetical protein